MVIINNCKEWCVICNESNLVAYILNILLVHIRKWKGIDPWGTPARYYGILDFSKLISSGIRGLISWLIFKSEITAFHNCASFIRVLRFFPASSACECNWLRVWGDLKITLVLIFVCNMWQFPYGWYFFVFRVLSLV